MQFSYLLTYSLHFKQEIYIYISLNTAQATFSAETGSPRQTSQESSQSEQRVQR